MLVGGGRFDEDAVDGVDFGELDGDAFVFGDVDGVRGEVGLDGEFAAAAVDEDGELDAGWASEVEEFGEGGADAAAGEDDFVTEDDTGAVDVEGDVGADEGGEIAQGAEVVAVLGDVEGADGDGGAGLGFEGAGEAFGEGDAAFVDADEDEGLVFFAGAAVEDFGGQTVDAIRYGGGVHEQA